MYKKNKPHLLEAMLNYGQMSTVLVEGHIRNFVPKYYQISLFFFPIILSRFSLNIHKRTTGPTYLHPCVSIDLNNLNNLSKGLPMERFVNFLKLVLFKQKFWYFPIFLMVQHPKSYTELNFLNNIEREDHLRSIPVKLF